MWVGVMTLFTDVRRVGVKSAERTTGNIQNPPDHHHLDISNMKNMSENVIPPEDVKYALTFRNKTVEAHGKVWERTSGKSQIKRENEISDRQMCVTCGFWVSG